MDESLSYDLKKYVNREYKWKQKKEKKSEGH